MAIVIRRSETRDDDAVADVLVDAFADEGPTIVALVKDLEGHPCGRDRLTWVADDESAIVGFTMVTRSRLDTERRTVDVGVLSPLAVVASRQRTGIGRALVAQAITAAATAGFPALFLEGDPAYYARRGFVPGAPLGFRKPSLRIPDAAFQVVLLPGHQSWMRGTLVYAEPFWDHDCVGLRDPGAPQD